MLDPRFCRTRTADRNASPRPTGAETEGILPRSPPEPADFGSRPPPERALGPRRSADPTLGGRGRSEDIGHSSRELRRVRAGRAVIFLDALQGSTRIARLGSTKRTEETGMAKKLGLAALLAVVTVTFS